MRTKGREDPPWSQYERLRFRARPYFDEEVRSILDQHSKPIFKVFLSMAWNGHLISTIEEALESPVTLKAEAAREYRKNSIRMMVDHYLDPSVHRSEICDKFVEMALRDLALGTEPNRAFLWNRDARRPRKSRTEAREREMRLLTPYLDARDGGCIHTKALAKAADACGLNERTIERAWDDLKKAERKRALELRHLLAVGDMK